MDFALKVALSFLVGGAYVSGIIWLSEKLGSRVGGAAAGLPSTILVSLIFIDLTEGPTRTQSAVAIVPLMFIATLIYGSVFLQAATRKAGSFMPTLFASVIWTFSAVIIRQLSGLNFFTIVLIALLGLGLFRYVFRRYSVTLPNKLPLHRQIYVFRFVIGGTVIAAAVVSARLLGPVWGGIISSAPALLGSVLYFLNKSQGEKFLEGFLRRLPFSYISSLLFLIIIHQTITKWPVPLSFMLAMAASLLYTFLLITNKRTEKI